MGLAHQFIHFLKQRKIKFRCSESGSRSIYIYVSLSNTYKIRFSDHPEQCTNAKSDLSIDPSTNNTLITAIDFINSRAR